jgi:hypothetical protein
MKNVSGISVQKMQCVLIESGFVLETCTVTLSCNAVSDHPKPVLYFDETCISHHTCRVGKMMNLV